MEQSKTNLSNLDEDGSRLYASVNLSVASSKLGLKSYGTYGCLETYKSKRLNSHSKNSPDFTKVVQVSKMTLDSHKSRAFKGGIKMNSKLASPEMHSQSSLSKCDSIAISCCGHYTSNTRNHTHSSTRQERMYFNDKETKYLNEIGK